MRQHMTVTCMLTAGSHTLTSDKDRQNAHTRNALDNIHSIPRDQEGPVFSAPWEAEVFAMTLTLYEQGLFEWVEWAAVLSEEISQAQQQGDPDLGDTYYLHWLAALESMITIKRIGSAEQLASLYERWDHAAQTTPHGQPITI